jgi:hypothetical protein
MGRAAKDRRQRLEEERAVENALIAQACETSSAIRSRLAAVADDLRKAALSAGTASENLLQLAKKFEQHARAGDFQ